MRTRALKNVAFGLAIGAAAFGAAGGFARAEDEKPAGGPAMQMQKKLEHPLAKALVGTWSIAHKSTQFPASTGTVKYALGVGDTALVQEYEVSMGPMGSFHGHSVSRVSDDGKSIKIWWIDILAPEMQLFEGSLTDTGFVTEPDAPRLSTTVNVTSYVPAAPYGWIGFDSVDVPPSPKSHDQDAIVAPSAAVDCVPSKLTESPSFTVPNAAVGSACGGGGGATVTCFEVELVRPVLSVTVSVTVYVPPGRSMMR